MKSLSHTSQQTLELGKKIGQAISGPVAIALTGDLGAGKTTLVQGMARGLGVDKGTYITSPTFTLINEYPGRDLRLCHLDLYRLGSADELEHIGFDDLLETPSVIVVEWPGLLEEMQFEFDLKISFEFDRDYNRVISLFPYGQTGKNLLSRLLL